MAGTNNAERNGRKRSVQPVIPALPLLPSRKNVQKSGNESVTDNEQSVHTAAPSAVSLEPSQNLGTSTQDNTKDVSTSNAITSHSDQRELSISSNPQLPESLKTDDPTIVVNGTNHDEYSTSTSHSISFATPLSDDSNPSKLSPDRTYVSLAGESTGFTSQIDSSVVSEEGETPEQSTSFVGEARNNSSHIDLQEEYPSTPRTLAKDMTSPEVVRHRGPKPQRRSEVAPEVLSNGHQREYSVYTGDAGKTNGFSILSAPVLPPVPEYLLYLANSKDLCDTLVQVNQPNQNLQPSTHYVHAIFLMRSPKFAKSIPEYDPVMHTRFIALHPARNIQPHAFEAALRFLYSDQILSVDTLISRDLSLDKAARLHYFDYIMSYWTAGNELGLVPVQIRARDMLEDILNWEIIEAVIKEAYAWRSIPLSALNRSSTSEFALLTNNLMQTALHFIAKSLDVSRFTLDTESQTSELNGRFSQLEVGRGASNPMLASMVFGSMPAHQSIEMSITSTVSAILLNLDFSDLQSLASELLAWHRSDTIHLLQDVVQEREKRRMDIIGNRMVSNKQRLSNSAAWEQAGWKEHLHDGHLSREQVDFLLPTRPR